MDWRRLSIFALAGVLCIGAVSCGKKDEVMEYLVEQIMFYLNKRAAGRMEIEVILYSNDFGELGKSAHAEAFLKKIIQNRQFV